MTENKLLFFLKPKIYPYLAEEREAAKFIKWGSLKIVVVSNNKKITLLETEWDLLPLIKWFDRSEQKIKFQTLQNSYVGLRVLDSESLAQALNRLQEQEFAEEQENLEYIWFDTLFEFREHHSLRFAMRGSKVPSIIIGSNRGSGEVSLSNRVNEWSYQFNLDKFFADFRKQALAFILDSQ